MSQMERVVPARPQRKPSLSRRVLLKLGLASRTFEERFQADRLSGPGVLIAGRWTYWNHDSAFATFAPSDRIEIGAFCAFAAGTRVVAGGEHAVDAITAYPLSQMDWAPGSPESAASPPAQVMIGNDVWVATGALILGGVHVGDGAVIAAGSVVTGDVPPYAVVGGVPARVIRMRFTGEEVAVLLRLRWWDWPDEMIRRAAPLLASGDIRALQQFASTTRAQSGAPHSDSAATGVQA